MILNKGFQANLPFCRTCLFHLSFPCSFTVFSEFCALFRLFSSPFSCLTGLFLLIFSHNNSRFLFFFCLSSCFNLDLSFFSLFVVVLFFSLLFSSFSSAFFPDFRSDKSGIFWHGIIFYFVYKILVFSLLCFIYTDFAHFFLKLVTFLSHFVFISSSNYIDYQWFMKSLLSS